MWETGSKGPPPQSYNGPDFNKSHFPPGKICLMCVWGGGGGGSGGLARAPARSGVVMQSSVPDLQTPAYPSSPAAPHPARRVIDILARKAHFC